MQIDNHWPWGPTNNYCKWFHVCEHESNHNGQIKWIKGRLPNASRSPKPTRLDASDRKTSPHAIYVTYSLSFFLTAWIVF